MPRSAPCRADEAETRLRAGRRPTEEAIDMVAIYPDLRDKTVLVTGGSRGIGAQTAAAFAAQGARVGVVGRDRDALARVVSDLTTSGATAIALAADVTDPAALA